MKGRDIKRIYGIRGIVPERINLEDEKDYLFNLNYSEGFVEIHELIFMCPIKIENNEKKED